MSLDWQFVKALVVYFLTQCHEVGNSGGDSVFIWVILVKVDFLCRVSCLEVVQQEADSMSHIPRQRKMIKEKTSQHCHF